MEQMENNKLIAEFMGYKFYNNLPEMQMIKEKLYDPKRIHRHKWQKGQLLIYNNKATNHKRENGGTKRHLWKIALYKR